LSSSAKAPVANPSFEASYERLFGTGIPIGPEAALFFDDFYQRFLKDPDIARLFAGTDIPQQSRMMRMSLYQLVAFYLLDEPNAELERLAERHRQVGASDAMFERWLQALIDTVAAHDPAFNAGVEQGWRQALGPGMTYFRRQLRC
jgi:truncated hemoglobin YjbI